MSPAEPMPPPTHIVMMAYLPLRRSSSCSAVAIWRDGVGNPHNFGAVLQGLWLAAHS